MEKHSLLPKSVRRFSVSLLSVGDIILLEHHSSLLTSTKPGVYLRAAAKARKYLFGKNTIFKLQLLKSLFILLQLMQSHFTKYHDLNQKRFLLSFHHVVSLKQGRIWLLSVCLTLKSNLPSFQIKVHFIYVFLISTIFLFQFLKFIECQTDLPQTLQVRRLTEKCQTRMENCYAILSKAVKYFKSTDSLSCWLV